MGRYSGKACRLTSMFGLTGTFFIVEIVVGYLTNSMALVADSFHMLSDIAALVIALISVRMAPKSWDKNTYGWARAEVLGALVNAVFLVSCAKQDQRHSCTRRSTSPSATSSSKLRSRPWCPFRIGHC